MEDLTSILGIVIAAGLLVAKVAVRKKATDATKGTADPHGEAWPQIPPFTTPDEETVPASEAPVFGPVAKKIAAARKSIQAAEEMLATDRSSAEAQDVSDHRAQVVTAPQSTAQPQVVSAAPRPSTMPQAVSATRSTIAPQENRRKKAETPAADFDLRKAVIASEILRPKFDE